LPCAPRQRKERERETGRMAKVNEVMKKTTSCRFQPSSFLPFFLPSFSCGEWRRLVCYLASWFCVYGESLV
jgi:hypothetical protein